MNKEKKTDIICNAVVVVLLIAVFCNVAIFMQYDVDVEKVKRSAGVLSGITIICLIVLYVALTRK